MTTPAIDALLNRLTLREKIGQTCQAQFSEVYTRAAGDLRGYLERFPVGSLFGGREIIGGAEFGAKEMHDALAECQAASRIPLSVAGDLESGAGCAIRGMTEFPRLMAVGAADSTEMAYDYGRLTALEARQVGFDWTFGPVVDLYLNWLNPVLGTRCLGDNPDRVIPLLEALIRGFQDHGLAATAKHFPGDGVDFRDQHLGVSVNSQDEATWHESFGRVFRSAIAAGVRSIMAGHIALPWLDARRGRGGRPMPATLSRPILTDLLRDELGFEGIIVSDALIMAGFTPFGTRRERTLDAFAAGIDVMLWPGEDYFDFMTEAVESGRISAERLDESVRRVLAFKVAQGQTLPGGDAVEAKAERPVVSLTEPHPSAEAREFTNRLAASCLTLVRNRLALLPLDPATTRNVLVLHATPRPATAEEKLAPFVQSLESRGLTVRTHVNGNCLDLVRLEAEGHRFDALLCVFDQQIHDHKNTMRPTGEMAECLWTLQNTETLEPIIISLGNPHLLHDTPYADTLINAYSSDEATLQALATALFSKAPLPGHLPVTIHGEDLAEKMVTMAR